MKLKQKLLLASAVLGLTLSDISAQTAITIGNQALLNGWDFNNILTPASTVRGRYSDVFGNNSSPTALTAPGAIYTNGTFGSDNLGAVAINTTGFDIDRDILTRTGTGSTFDLGGQTGGDGAFWLNGANVGTAAQNEFSINLHTKDATNSFKDLTVLLSGRDVGNTAGGVTINWAYSIDAGVTKIATGLSTVFTGNVFGQQLVDFSAIAALDDVANIYLIAQIVESQTSAVLSLDNIGAYAVAFTAIPEPSTYAAIMGALVIGVAAIRRRRSQIAA